jgi:hypothetical protein
MMSGGLTGLFPRSFAPPLDEGRAKPDIRVKWPADSVAGR